MAFTINTTVLQRLHTDNFEDLIPIYDLLQLYCVVHDSVRENLH